MVQAQFQSPGECELFIPWMVTDAAIDFCGDRFDRIFLSWLSSGQALLCLPHLGSLHDENVPTEKGHTDPTTHSMQNLHAQMLS